MPPSTILHDHGGDGRDNTQSRMSRQESFPNRVFKSTLLSWLLISIPCLSFALPVPKVFVVPPLVDGQTQTNQIGKRLSSSLKEYLKKSKRLTLEDGKAKLRESKDDQLMEAESIKVSSIDLYKEGKFEEARAGFVSSLKGFHKSTASIRDMKSVYQALYYMAAACMALEYDDDAKDYLRQLAAISPEGNFEVQVPKNVEKKYKRERKRLLKKKRGAIAIETTPPGAQVWVNGEKVCVSPCEVKDLPRGKHYIWAEKAGVGKAGSVTKVKAGWSSPLKYNLKPSKKEKSTDPVPKELLAKIQDKLSNGVVDGQLKEYLDLIAEEQEVGYTVFLFLLTKKRNVKLFSFVYDFNEKRAVATSHFKFKANFSATRITAMKLVKEVEALIKIFPEDKNIDGVYQPLLDAINEMSKDMKVAVVPPVPPVATVDPVAPKLPKPAKVSPPLPPPPPPVTPSVPTPKVTKSAPVPVAAKPPLVSPKTDSFKAPPKPKQTLLPPPAISKNVDESNDGILASPWFWTGVSVAILAGATTGAILLLDTPSDNQSYQSRVSW